MDTAYLYILGLPILCWFYYFSCSWFTSWNLCRTWLRLDFSSRLVGLKKYEIKKKELYNLLNSCILEKVLLCLYLWIFPRFASRLIGMMERISRKLSKKTLSLGSTMRCHLWFLNSFDIIVQYIFKQFILNRLTIFLTIYNLVPCFLALGSHSFKFVYGFETRWAWSSTTVHLLRWLYFWSLVNYILHDPTSLIFIWELNCPLSCQNTVRLRLNSYGSKRSIGRYGLINWYTLLPLFYSWFLKLLWSLLAWWIY